MMDIINQFDRLDNNDDAKITKSEYIAVRKRQYKQKYDRYGNRRFNAYRIVKTVVKALHGQLVLP